MLRVGLLPLEREVLCSVSFLVPGSRFWVGLGCDGYCWWSVVVHTRFMDLSGD